MALSEEEVRHIALLSRLQLTDEEVKLYAEQLTHILDYVKKLQDLDTSGIEPMISASASSGVFRVDEPRPGLQREAAFESAPSHDAEYFRVPPVIE
jgi:aspartyl-tRNA(Asn)/glutamyl-tRNA(Gln) amidotransferase subunit C